MNISVKSIALAALLSGVASSAMALGTASGTLITNSIDISFTSGGQTISQSNVASAGVMVDRAVDFTIQGLDAGKEVTAEGGANDAVLVYQVTNTGNAASGYDLDITPSGTLGLTLGSGEEGSYWAVISDSPVPGAGTETAYDPTGTVSIGDLAADGSAYLHIHANLPDTAASASYRDFAVTARPVDAGTNTLTVELTGQGLTAMDIVFNDPGLDGTESDTERLSVLAPLITASKTASVLYEKRDGSFDCVNGAGDPSAEVATPGSCVEYVITISNDAAATLPINGLTINDPLPAHASFAALDKGDFDDASESGGVVTASIASIAPGSSATMRIRVILGE